MNPALNGSSTQQRFERSNAIEIRNGIMFDFYPGLPHMLIKFWGNLEQKLDFGTCCSRKFRSKSEIMFLWEAHLSTVKASQSCLTLLLYLGRTADYLLRVQILVGGITSASSSSLCMSWRHALFATSCLLNLYANSSTRYFVITYSFHVPGPNFQSKCRRST